MALNNTLGQWGEMKAARYLSQCGYQIITRNYRTKFGEIDIVAEDDSYLLFVEVRLRKTTRYGRPEETVDYHKQKKLRMAANHYLMEHPTHKQPRFDVIALYAAEGMETRPLPLKHIKNAF